MPYTSVVVQLPCCVWLFKTPWTAACQAFLSFTISWSLLKSCSLSWWCWGRKGTGWADSILKKKETPSCTFCELWTMLLVALGITYLWQNWPPRLIKPDSRPRFPVSKKNVIIPYIVNHLFNLCGTHWGRLQCITSWPFWLWIMAVTWLYLPLTLFRLGLRNLGMWAWAVR